MNNTATAKKPRKLTAKKLSEKFPDMEPNENCLQDISCPKCGNRDSFRITMSSIFSLFDKGTDEHEDTEWGPNSFCQCRECQHEGKVKNFTFPGLDKLLHGHKPCAKEETLH